jgi:shikimate kinase
MVCAPVSIFLVGMMGAGKSTVGRLLGQALGWNFVDADRELEARSGVAVSTIFELEGEDGFRQREAALLDELTRIPRCVLATGGGAVLREDNRRALHERGFVVYLRVGVDEVLRRTRRDTSRPLLQTADPRARVQELLAKREPLYESVAHLTLVSAATNPRRMVERVLAAPALAGLRESTSTRLPDDHA